MIFDKKTWNEIGKGFGICDATFGPFDGTYGFLLSEDINSTHPDPLPRKRFLFANLEKPLESRFFLATFENFLYATISATQVPNKNEFVIVETNCLVFGCEIKGHHNIEQPINNSLFNTDLVSSISKVVRINNSIYAIGNPVRVYRRIQKDTWEDFSGTIPISDDFISKNNLNYSLRDMAGFSEKDIYAVGEAGVVWHFNGKNWQQIVFPTNQDLYTVVCAEDGYVYITSRKGHVWIGRNSTWNILTDKKMPLRFLDSVWFDDRLWCTNDYGVWVLEDGELVRADKLKQKPIPEYIQKGLCGRIDVSFDKQKLLICGNDGAALYDGQTWSVLFDRKQLES
ncbi:hypothetical protein [Flavobacterium sp. FlaQc-48]|uniref:hypothetical protein n=1 Tax=Flavobacterium sp. FlaQc-48 TaxID=3374181 RepID=UPI003756A431